MQGKEEALDLARRETGGHAASGPPNQRCWLLAITNPQASLLRRTHLQLCVHHVRLAERLERVVPALVLPQGEGRAALLRVP